MLMKLSELVIYLRFKAHNHKIMQFTTPVELPKGEAGITHNDRIMLVGSCFAGNIGNKLKERKFCIDINPFGTQYNPLSINSVLRRVAAGELFDSNSPELFAHNGMWHSIMHHSDFSRQGKDELLECINGRLQQAHAIAKECSTVIVTLGTAYAYIRRSDNTVAGNCHKLPAREFERRLLTIGEIIEDFERTIELYRSISPDVRFIFTVSPIRHLRDGAHDNQKSKATLLLAIDGIMERHPGCCRYFPAYEIVLDELRDYRFYAEDMLHPSDLAVKYIWECFAKCYFNRETCLLNERIEEIMRGLSHRPFDSSSEGYRQFIGNTLGKIEEVTARHSCLDFEKEIMLCNTLLNR